MSRRLCNRPTQPVSEFHGMVTVAPQMLELFALIEKVARTEVTVMVRGETGTGKELVARALHALSRRSNGPFEAINCATLTPELLASELFGHVRGAFTGAIRDRVGLFERANGGTVFLDEVAEIPLDIQARLLRVLQERSFVPLGGADPVQVDVRILSATHKALRQEVEQHRFRGDLMYRLRVVPLFLPRLAERDGDVAALTWRFIDELNEISDRAVDSVATAAHGALCGYDWPGNIRELRNVIEYAFAVGEGSTLTLDELPPELRGEGPPEERPRAAMSAGERNRIVEALQESGGRKGNAAEALGISRATLWRKMREYRIG